MAWYDVGWSQNNSGCTPCQLNPYWDFEDLTNTVPLTQGANPIGSNPPPFYFVAGYVNNTPDLVTVGPNIQGITSSNACDSPLPNTVETGNTTKRIGFYAEIASETIKNSEGFYIKLCEPILPGMKGRIKFKALVPQRCLLLNYSPKILCQFTANEPISGEVVSINPGFVGNTYEKAITTNEIVPPHYGDYEIDIVNNTAACWNYLVVSGRLDGPVVSNETIRCYYYMDNLEVLLTDNKITDNMDVSITASTLQPCLGGTLDVNVELCNTSPSCAAGEVQPANPAFSILPALPSGMSFVGTPNLAVGVGEIPPGECKTLTFTVAVDNNLALNGQNLPIQLVLKPIASCYLQEPQPNLPVVPVYCPPAPPCTCPPGSTVYSINPGVNVSTNLSQWAVPATVSNACIEVNGLLKIDADLTLNNVQLVASPGAHITVLEERTFSIINSSLLSCNNMWKGITVNSGATLLVNGTNGNTSKISDAQYAIEAMKGAALGTTNTIFDRNYIAVRVPPTGTGGIAQVDGIPFKGCSFTATSNLLPAYIGQIPAPGTRGLYAFQLLNVNGFNIGANTFGTLTISGLQNGLFASNGSFSLRGANISAFSGNHAGNWQGVRAINCKAALITRCSISDYRIGIYAQGCNTNILDNVLTGAINSAQSGFQDIGMHLIPGSGKKTVVKLGNLITKSEIGIKVQNLTAPVAGSIIEGNRVDGFESGNFANAPLAAIVLQFVKGMRVYSNIMGEQNGSAITGSNHTGIFAIESDENTIYDNSAYSLKNGYEMIRSSSNYLLNNQAVKTVGSSTNSPVNGFNTFTSENNHFCCNITNNLLGNAFDFKEDCAGTDFEQSRIYDAGIGLLLSSDGVIGTQLNKKNRWLGTYSSGFGAQHESSDPNLISDSKFKTATNWMPTWTTGIGMNAQWFAPDLPQNDPLSCDCKPLPAFGGTGDDRRFSTDGDAAQGTLLSPLRNWDNQRSLYRRLGSNYSTIVNAPPPPGLTSNELAAYGAATTSITSFYAAQQAPGAAVRNYQDMDLSIALFRDGTTAQQAQSAILTTDVLLWFDSLVALYGIPVTPTILAARKNVALHLQLAINNVDNWQSNTLANQNQALSSLVVSNAQLGSTAPYQAKEREIDQLYLSGRFWETTPTSPNWTAIKAIADLCPNQYGRAVFMARNLYMYYKPNYTWDDNSCTESAERQRTDSGGSTAAIGSPNWQVSPNPSQGWIWFNSETPLTHATQLQVFGSYGQLVQLLSVPAGTAQIMVDGTAWQTGMYFYRLTTSEGKPQAGQFIITK
jgi:parallel beta-helix repeat protein